MALLPAPVNPATPSAVPRRLTQPAQSRVVTPLRGRVYGSKGAPVHNPVTGQGPPVYPLTQPVRTRIVLPPRGRNSGSQGAPVHNPTSGPRAPALSGPAGVLVVLVRTGDAQASVQSSPVVIPSQAQPPRQPVMARQPLPARGRAYGNDGAPVRNPAPAAAPPRPLTQPARYRIIPPPRGRAYGHAGAPVSNPVTGQGPPFRPQGLVRIRVTLPPRGRTYGNKGAPAVHAGPVFRQATSPVRAPVPQPFSKGRVSGNAGAPVHNPVTGQGPPFYPQGTIRFRVTQPPRGRTYSDKGAPAVHAGPQFRQAASPARAPVAAPFSKGRASGSRGAPVQNPVTPAPFRQATSPVRAPAPQPFSRGRAAFTRRTPVVNPSAPAYPQGKALRAQPAVFLKGRIVTTPRGIIHNPSSGPVFQLPTQPARYRITLPPRGRAYGNPGGPVSNPVEGAVPPGTLYLTPGTIIQGQAYAATTIATGGGILTISNAEGAVTVITPAAEGYAPSSITPPPDSDIPPPDSVVVPAYVQR